ncbi:hypothetical protein HHUSO_G5263 [Huso huso]|uniref:YqaJ viral recombinase domain-containing protein n=1 Tax=Huso huso TaxID=61971 RepID=A0ABR1A264_HUSHU
MGFQSVPPVTSKMSLPQSWHIPQRTKGLNPKPVHTIKISKLKPLNNIKRKKSKKQRISEGILPTLYCPVHIPIPGLAFAEHLQSNLSSINSEAQFLKLLPNPLNPSQLSQTKFGALSHGSVLSYQQKELQSPSSDLIYITDVPVFPPFPLPSQTSNFCTVLGRSEIDYYAGLQLDLEIAKQLEIETRDQSSSKTWHAVRAERLTSSVFKRICCRVKDFERLAKTLCSYKPIQTKAMKHGLEHEPVAAKLYSEITGNNVYMCGFVVNTHAPHLGTSPDRKVYDPSEIQPYGLQEIKCPDSDTFTMCLFLKKNSFGSFSIKKSHEYYYLFI